MRLNIMNRSTWEKYPTLLKGWVQAFAKEFDIEEQQAQQYLYWHPDTVAEFLNNRGWNITPYELPNLLEGERRISKGYVLDESCTAYVSWRLTHT
jgi:hypothetical protein